MITPILFENTRVLVMCSSRGRPEKLNDMIDSVEANKSEGTELVVYIAEDDPRIADYAVVLARVKHIVGPRRNMVEVLNYLACEVYPNMEYYTDLNDDQYVITPNWDTKMIEACNTRNDGWCISAIQSSMGLPYAGVIPGKLVRAIGHYFPRMFVHTWVDNVLREYEHAGLLVYVPDVVVEHRHPCFGTPPDETFSAWSATAEQFSIGQAAFENWARTCKHAEWDAIEAAKKSGGQ